MSKLLAAVAAAFIALLVVAPFQTGSSAAQAPDVLLLGQDATAWLYNGEAELLWERSSPALQTALGEPGNWVLLRDQLLERIGAETEVLNEISGPDGDLQIYTRFARFEKVAQPVALQWAFDANGIIVGFFIRPT